MGPSRHNEADPPQVPPPAPDYAEDLGDDSTRAPRLARLARLAVRRAIVGEGVRKRLPEAFVRGPSGSDRFGNPFHDYLLGSNLIAAMPAASRKQTLKNNVINVIYLIYKIHNR